MSLLWLVSTMAVVGGLLWVVNRQLPGKGRLATLLNSLVLAFLILWMLYSFDHFSRWGAS